MGKPLFPWTRRKRARDERIAAASLAYSVAMRDLKAVFSAAYAHECADLDRSARSALAAADIARNDLVMAYAS